MMMMVENERKKESENNGKRYEQDAIFFHRLPF